MDKWNVGILIFDNVEVLDFAGPFEVFSRTRLQPGPEARRSDDDSAPFRVFTVARSTAPVVTTGGRRVLPHFGLADAPPIDLLVVPGGFGTRALIHDEDTLAWIRRPRPSPGRSAIGSRSIATRGGGTTASSRRPASRRGSTWPSTSSRRCSGETSPRRRPVTSSSEERRED